MKVTHFTCAILLILFSFTTTSKKGFFYCIDHPGKTVYYSSGDVVIKKNLEKNEYYQYGFMKWKGWIDKSWQGLEYDLKFYSPGTFKKSAKGDVDSLLMVYRTRGYKTEAVHMPYPMKPYANIKKIRLTKYAVRVARVRTRIADIVAG